MVDVELHPHRIVPLVDIIGIKLIDESDFKKWVQFLLALVRGGRHPAALDLARWGDFSEALWGFAEAVILGLKAVDARLQLRKPFLHALLQV